jgi:hypothetical protein
MDIGHFVPGTDSMDSDAEIENHERQLEQTLLKPLGSIILTCSSFIGNKIAGKNTSIDGEIRRLPTLNENTALKVSDPFSRSLTSIVIG